MLRKNYLLTLYLLIGQAALLYANEGAAEGHSSDFLWKVVNFIILIGILVYFAKKPVQTSLTNSALEAKKELEDARALKQQVVNELQQFQTKLESLKQETEAMLKTAKMEAEMEKKEIIEEAQQLAQKLKTHAQFTIDQEYKKAQQDLRHWIAQELAQQAEAKLNQQLTPDHQNTLVNDYLKELTQPGGTA